MYFKGFLIKKGKKTKQNKNENKGITLIALVITIIVLLILAGVTINTLFGEDGAIKKAVEAREATDIANEKDTVSMSVIALKTESKEMTQGNLQEAINNTTGNKDKRVEDIGDGSFLVFFQSGRVYEVDKNGNVRYAGKENEIDKVIVTADKESDLEPKQIQQVQIYVKKYNAKAEDTIKMQYAWSTSKTDEPASYKNAQFEEDKEAEEDGDIEEGENTETNTFNKTAIIDSGEQPTNSYYLWIKVNVGSSQEIKRTYGEYKIQEYTTLVNTSGEYTAESGFLGSKDINKGDIKNITRGKIKSITITNTIAGHSVKDDKCWDIGNLKKGIILAWYEKGTTTAGEEYYNVTIGQEGGVQANASSINLFRNIGSDLNEEVKIEGLKNLKTNKVINMKTMFDSCTNLKSIELNGFDTNKVTNMQGMFDNCCLLKTLNCSSFDTSNVVTMDGMFSDCKALTSLNLDSFNTSNVVNMAYMFSSCSSLNTLDVSKFKTENVKTMKDMFSNCNNLQQLYLKNFKTNTVANMKNMFRDCYELTELDLDSFDTSNVTDMANMFMRCYALKKLNISKFNTNKVVDMQNMFGYCHSLEKLELNNFNTSNVVSMYNMFMQCQSLTNLNLSSFNTSNVINMAYMFSECSSLNTLDISNFKTENVKTMKNMFSECENLNYLDVSNFDFSVLTDMMYIFRDCKSLENLKLNNWKVPENANAYLAFNNIPNDCNVFVSTQEMKDWVLSKNNNLTNIKIMDSDGNIIESKN